MSQETGKAKGFIANLKSLKIIGRWEDLWQLLKIQLLLLISQQK